jgi:hypothetical protein
LKYMRAASWWCSCRCFFSIMAHRRHNKNLKMWNIIDWGICMNLRITQWKMVQIDPRLNQAVGIWQGKAGMFANEVFWTISFLQRNSSQGKISTI